MCPFPIFASTRYLGRTDGAPTPLVWTELSELMKRYDVILVFMPTIETSGRQCWRLSCWSSDIRDADVIVIIP